MIYEFIITCVLLRSACAFRDRKFPRCVSTLDYSISIFANNLQVTCLKALKKLLTKPLDIPFSRRLWPLHFVGVQMQETQNSNGVSFLISTFTKGWNQINKMDKPTSNKDNKTWHTAQTHLTAQDVKLHASPLGTSKRFVTPKETEGISDRDERIGESGARSSGMSMKSGSNHGKQYGLPEDSASKKADEPSNSSIPTEVSNQSSLAGRKEPRIPSLDRRELFVKAQLTDYSEPHPDLPTGPGYPPVHNFAPSAHVDRKIQVAGTDGEGGEKPLVTHCPECKKKIMSWGREDIAQREINSVYGLLPSHSRAQPLVERYERRSADMLVFQSEKYYHLAFVGEGDQNPLRRSLMCPECAPDAYEIVDHHSLHLRIKMV